MGKRKLLCRIVGVVVSLAFSFAFFFSLLPAPKSGFASNPNVLVGRCKYVVLTTLLMSPNVYAFFFNALPLSSLSEVCSLSWQRWCRFDKGGSSLHCWINVSLCFLQFPNWYSCPHWQSFKQPVPCNDTLCRKILAHFWMGSLYVISSRKSTSKIITARESLQHYFLGSISYDIQSIPSGKMCL